MAPSLEAKKAVLFHLLNFNLLMDLGVEPPGVEPMNPTTTTTTTTMNPHHELAAALVLDEPVPPVHPAAEKCHNIYGQEVCFSLQPPWVTPSRPVVRAPRATEDIATTFSLFTRLNDTIPTVLDPTNLSTIMWAPFVPGQPFKVIIHGYFSHGNTAWAKTLRGELLRAADQNVVVVDWSRGAMPPYTQAVANIRVVGVQLAYLIYTLHKFADVSISSFHLIGHSLGAHLSGHSGTLLKDHYDLTLPRITGLDPAEPYFNDTDPVTRLDTSDAAFVDVIHTDDAPIFGFPLSLGMTHPIGHLDFYPNGGKQPGCDNGPVNCQHTRAIIYFTESIRQSCTMLAVACPSYEKFIRGECWGCEGAHRCSPLGLAAAPLPVPPRTSLYLDTRAESPHCGYHYRVTVTASNTSEARQHMGEFAITHLRLEGHKDYTPKLSLSTESHYYEAGTTYRRVLLTRDIGRLLKVTVHFDDPTWLFPRFTRGLFIESVTVEPLGKNVRWRFCFEDAFQKFDQDYTLSLRNAC